MVMFFVLFIGIDDGYIFVLASFYLDEYVRATYRRLEDLPHHPT